MRDVDRLSSGRKSRRWLQSRRRLTERVELVYNLSMRLVNRRFEPDGFTLIEAVITMGIVSLVALLAAFGVANLAKQNTEPEVASFLEQYRNDIRNALRAPASWNQMINLAGATVNGHPNVNKEMKCLQPDATGALPYDCSPNGVAAMLGTAPPASPPYRLVAVNGLDSFGNPIVINDSENLSAGFTVKGQPCNTFSKTAPDANCPFRVTVGWTPQCGQFKGAACPNPEVVTNVGFFVSSTDGAINKIDAGRYTFRLYRGPNADKIKTTCIAMSGAYDLVSGTCTVASLANCPPGQFIVGFNSTATGLTPQCGTVAADFSCPQPTIAGKFEPLFLRGVASTGLPVCEPCH